MDDRYLFRKIFKSEIPQVFSMILQRIEWMSQKGIRQWNVTNYTNAYPLSYYEAECESGRLFVLADTATEQIVCAAVLKEQDDRWPDDSPALYLHNFVSSPDARGTGTVFLRYAEAYARQLQKQYFRLDSARDNQALAAYYKTYGFEDAGDCEDGLYKGILRQKRIECT